MRPSTNHGERLASLESCVDERFDSISRQIDSKHDLLMERLKPIDDFRKDLRTLEDAVEDHARKISWTRGAVAVCGFIWTTALTLIGFRHHG